MIQGDRTVINVFCLTFIPYDYELPQLGLPLLNTLETDMF